MANICTDTVVFYADTEEQEVGLEKLKVAVSKAYPGFEVTRDARMIKIFEENNIATEGIYLRGDVMHSSIEEDSVTLDCDAAWNPMWDAYNALADFFEVSFVMQAEEPGSSLYINTDSYGLYLPNHYKIVIHGRPADGSLNKILKTANRNTDIYFNSTSDILRWFGEAGIEAQSLEDLYSKLDADYITIHEYGNPYE